MNTSDIIFSLMAKKGVTAYQLSKELEITESLFSHWKKGLQKPKTEAIIKIAKYFGVTTDYLLGLTDDPQQKSSPIETGEQKKLAKILNDYMTQHNLHIADEKELKIALDTFAATIQSLQKNKE